MFTPDTYKLVYALDEVKKTFAQFKLQSAELPLLTDLIRLEKTMVTTRLLELTIY